MSYSRRVDVSPSEKILVNTKELAGLLSIGYNTAAEIGDKAGARVTIGRRKLYNVQTVRTYIDSNRVLI